MKIERTLSRLLLGASALGLTWLLASCAPAAQPGTDISSVLWDTPQFTLTNQDDQPVRTTDLAGKVWLANFIFTNCPDVCPTELIPKMQQIQKAVLADPLLAARVRLLSISVDPPRDTPAVLHDYAKALGADTDVWWFLVGTTQDTVDLMQNGFKVGIAQTAPVTGTPAADLTAPMSGMDHSAHEDAHYTIDHSTRFVLVDAQGKVRAEPLSSDVTAEEFVSMLHQLVSVP